MGYPPANPDNEAHQKHQESGSCDKNCALVSFKYEATAAKFSGFALLLLARRACLVGCAFVLLALGFDFKCFRIFDG